MVEQINVFKPFVSIPALIWIRARRCWENVYSVQPYPQIKDATAHQYVLRDINNLFGLFIRATNNRLPLQGWSILIFSKDSFGKNEEMVSCKR